MPSSTYVTIMHRNIDRWLRLTANIDHHPTKKSNRELDNLERLVKQASHYAETQNEKLGRLLAQSYPLVEGYGRWQKWLPFLQKGASFVQNEHPSLHIELLCHQGKCLNRTARYQEALAIHQQADALLTANHEIELHVETKHNLCVDFRCTKAFDQAEVAGQTALQLAQESDISLRKTAVILNELGFVELDRGQAQRLDIAERRFKEALDCLDIESAPVLYCKVAINLGLTLWRQEKKEEALHLYRTVEPTILQYSPHLDRSRYWNALGILYFQLEQYSEAEAILKRAYSEVVKQSGDIFAKASLNQNIGNALQEQNRLREAEHSIWRAILLYRKIDQPKWLANSYGTFAQVKRKQNEREEALTYYEQAITLLEEEDQGDEVTQRMLAVYRAEHAELAQ